MTGLFFNLPLTTPALRAPPLLRGNFSRLWRHFPRSNAPALERSFGRSSVPIKKGETLKQPILHPHAGAWERENYFFFFFRAFRVFVD